MNSLIKLNFYFTVWLSIIGGLALFNNPDWFLADPEDIYGPLKNNLLIVLMYLVVSQLAMWFLSYARKRHSEALIMGAVFLLVGAGTLFYATVNALPYEEWLSGIMFYVGVSHVLYYWQGTPRPAAGQRRP